MEKPAQDNGEECPKSTSAGLPGQDVPSCCRRKTNCPEGFVLSEPLDICGRRDCNLNELENYTWTEINNASSSCWTRDQGGWYYKPEAATCQTCVYVGDTTTVTSTRTVPDTGCVGAVGDSGRSACRGRDVDNLVSYYTVYGAQTLQGSARIFAFKQYPSCKGIEYSEGRCEIWTRPQGIYVSKKLSGFSCFRFGWATQSLAPLDGGSGRACRGDSPTDNWKAYYSVSQAYVLEDCKAQCSAASLCFGIEFSLGRCEIWLRPIHAVAQISGFSCFGFLSFLPWPSFPKGRLCTAGNGMQSLNKIWS